MVDDYMLSVYTAVLIDLNILCVAVRNHASETRLGENHVEQRADEEYSEDRRKTMDEDFEKYRNSASK